MKKDDTSLELLKLLKREQIEVLMTEAELQVSGIWHSYLGNGMMRRPNGQVVDVCLSRIEAIRLPARPEAQPEAATEVATPKPLPKGLFGKL